LALAYEVFIECVLEHDIQGMSASLAQMRQARAHLLDGGALAEAGGSDIDALRLVDLLAPVAPL
jgi:hypothetical protein